MMMELKASDADEEGSDNANVTYWIESASSGAGNFTVNPYTGQIVPKFPGLIRRSKSAES